ncbi:hypothetical protein V8G54_003840 [Vigna mungo]|uniref:Uncharacterized protein n=1 Tax=Vigna mungo TaxID=3915 RepID=A0AAQ3PCG5_VIGMU
MSTVYLRHLDAREGDINKGSNTVLHEGSRHESMRSDMKEMNKLLDIKSLVEIRQLGSPNVRVLRKKVVLIFYTGDDNPRFLKKLDSSDCVTVTLGIAAVAAGLSLCVLFPGSVVMPRCRYLDSPSSFQVSCSELLLSNTALRFSRRRKKKMVIIILEAFMRVRLRRKTLKVPMAQLLP